jgi:signal peptidase I
MAPSEVTASQPAQGDGEVTNIKETIESILVAFILAFIFRAFVVEAFVIPTGSMAPTLLGAHMRFRCPDCGWVFDVNYSAETEADSEDMRMPADAYPRTDIYCPNCGYHIAAPPHRDAFDRLSGGDAVPVNYGDRILVLKYIYLLHGPRRWDVVVFKSPDDPDKTHYQQNFIKRLVGLPGEKLMVLDGDIYKWNVEQNKWGILRDKPRRAQEALWRLVYNNDFYPQQAQRAVPPQFVQPWRPEGTGWDESHGRAFYFDNLQGVGTLRFDPTANSTTQTLTDYLVYDAGAGMLRRPEVVGSNDDANANPVSDLKLACYYTRTSGTGALRLHLSRFADVDHEFTAEITPDSVRLIHRTNSGGIETWDKKLAEAGISAGKPMFIEFMNVDYRVTLRINDQQIFQPLDYDPNVDWLLKQYHDGHRRGRWGEAAIEAENQQSKLEHISLYRDVYYTNRGMNLHTATPDNPVQLGSREYFVMGDNSPISKDARYWDAPISLPHEGLTNVAEGRVPEQFLLGKAVFVYWPAGYRLTDLLHVALIPNFGDMRWIH